MLVESDFECTCRRRLFAFALAFVFLSTGGLFWRVPQADLELRHREGPLAKPGSGLETIRF